MGALATIRKSYVDGPYGQIHLRETAPVPDAPPLVCLHATAYSSRTFLPLMERYAGRRQVIAIDAPGYGASDAPAGPIDMAGYAGAVAAVLKQRCDRPVEVLGYHTGAYMAAELAVTQPRLVERVILIGIPYFEAIGREQWQARLGARHRLSGELDQFAERWDWLVTQACEQGIARDRAFDNFVDELRAWPNGWWAHDAMFAWPSRERLPRLTRPVLILNPAGHLAAASRAAATLIPDAHVVEMADVDGPVLELAPDRIIDTIEAARGVRAPGRSPLAAVPG